MNEYDIDLDIFSYDEIGKIINFFILIEKTKKGRVKKELLKEKYKEYRTIISSIALEKKYDKMLQKKSGISIYKVMRDL